jgi:natural product biosynthesis luciferase-like monooxygenase protein/amino acid adenylation domain-containing protein/FkbM family methyltransferase
MENVESIYPLSPMQLDILLRSLRAPELAEYAEQIRWTMQGDLDAPAFARAWQRLAERHPVLRTVFFWKGLDNPLQVVRRTVEARVELLDWRGEPSDALEERMEGLVRRERRRFDLEAAPLFRVALVRTGEREHRCVWTCHHLLLDGWSAGRALQEVFALYDALVRGEAPALPAPPPFQAYISWLQAQPTGPAEGFWRAALAGVGPASELDPGRPLTRGDAAGSAAPGHAAATIPAARLERLEEAARRRQLTLNTLFQGAWALVLGRRRGDDDVVFGAVSSGRPAELPGAEAMLGVFVGSVPVRARLRPEAEVGPWLRELQAAQAEARRHDHFALQQIQAWSGVPAGERLFDTLLVFQNYPLREVESARVAGLEVRDLRGVPADSALGHALMLEVDVRREAALSLAFDGDRWDAEAAGRLLEQLRNVLDGMARDPDPRLADLSLLSAAERARVLEAWNATAAAYPGDRCVHELVAEQAARTPDAPALVWQGGSLTYAELQQRAGRLAQLLARRGVGPDRRVGLCMERGADQLVALLAVLRAGGCYVPLDPAYPAERLGYMLRDSGASVLLTQERMLGELPEFGGEIVVVDTPHPPAPSPTRGEGENDDAGGEDTLSHSRTFALSHSLSLAYVVYTSGSTGTPKGVAMPHRALVNLLAWQAGAWRGARAARTLQFASISFDVSFQEIFSAWTTGGALVLLREEERRDPDALLRRMEEEGVERCFLPWVALQHVAERARERRVVPSRLREVVTAGEQLRVTPAIRGWMEALGVPLHNQYGPSETHVVTAHTLEGAPGAWPLLPAIGGGIANTRCFVLDGWTEPAPAGVPGELYVAGASLARGYLDRPGATAERFLPDPFSREAGGRMYRTGDRVRWLADGTLEFLGRTDQQLKVRGFRVEPGEIEAALERHAAVREALVLAREDAPGEKRLVGYVVPAEGAAVSPAELREHLLATLPEHMVPGAFVVLDGFPLTPSGKTDRRALPAPDAEHGYAAPRTPVQEVLAGAWAEVLGVERVGVEDDFFALGGHSLLAARVVSRVREALGVELPLPEVFAAPTVAGLARRVEALLGGGAGEEAPPLVPVPRDDAPLPLSFAQQRLWFIDRLEPGSAAYNLPYAIRVRGPLDLGALGRALTDVARRHEALRTRFPERGGEPVQWIEPARPAPLPLVDLGGLGGAAREEELARLAAREARRPFHLAAGPLLRAAAVRLGEDDAAVLLTMHHVVSDGWSLGILVRELSALYAGHARGEDPRLPELPVQYVDFATWQRAWLSGDVLERQLDFWRGELRGAPPLLELPADRPRPAVMGGAGGRVDFRVDAETAAGVRALARREGATPFMALLAAWQLLLARWSGQEDVVVGTPVAGRNRLETEGLIGFFVNTLALRGDVSGDPGFRELLRRVRGRTLEAYAHQDLPFERLVEELGVERSRAHAPLFQVVFALQTAVPEPRLGAAEVQVLETGSASPKFDLSLGIADDAAGGLAGGLEYAAALREPATAARMAEQYAVLLAGIVADPGARAMTLPLMTAAERRRVLAEGHGPERGAAPGECVHELVARQAARAPDAVALWFRGATLTYGELDRRANRLAHYLHARGVGPEARVGVCLERTPELVVALLAVLRAGGAYVPLDPAYPAARLRGMIEDAGAGLVLTSAALAGVLPEDAAALALGTLRLDGEPDTAPASGVGPENLSHVIFTSGSTGRPKGVMIRHSSTVALLHWLREAVTDEERSAVLFSTSVSFDVAVAELFGTLAWGGRLVLVENALELATAAEPVVHASMVPTAAAELLRSGGIPASVRTLNLGGEPLPADLARDLYALGTVEKVGNLYGPTEDTTYSTYSLVGRGAVTLGRPLPGTRAYVLDGEMEPVPAGVAGELYLAGDGLARGYAGRPELTAERFLPDPFGPAGARMYRVMDRVRRRSDGELEYLGRTDFQVKVRGFRIELGEVEAALRAHPEVREAVAVVREDAPGDRRIVAYVVPRGGTETAPPPADLRAWLGERLPGYMVPSALVVLDALPLTGSGKTDRRALPAPEGAAASKEYVAPRTAMEERVAAVFAEVLGAARVGVHDDFFDEGGHSLLATRAAGRLQRELGIRVPVGVLFEHTTVAGVAAWLEAERGGDADPSPPAPAPVPRDGSPLPLSPAQQRIWLQHQLATSSYNLPVALRMRGDLAAEALRGALEAVVARHEVLRSRLVLAGGEPVQTVEPARPFALPTTDLAPFPEAEREAAVARYAAEEAARPFDLEAPPLLRAALLRLAEREHVLLLTLHHVAADGWSEAVLVRELGAHYDALVSGRPAALPPLPLQYVDYAVWQRGLAAGGARQRKLEFWSRALADVPAALELPADRPRPPVQSFRGDTFRFRVEAPRVQVLRALGHREDCTLFMVLLAGFDAWLHRYTGQDDLVVGTPLAGRDHPSLEPLIGCFINVLPVRVRVDADDGFRGLLARVRAALLEAYPNGDVSFDRIVETAGLPRDASRSPLVQVLFALQNTPLERLELPGVTAERVEVAGRTSRYDLSLYLREEPDGALSALVEFAADLYDRSTVERWTRHWARLLDALAADPERPVGDVELLDAAEREQVLRAWNPADAPPDAAATVAELFAAQVRRAPDAEALVAGGERLTYAELAGRAGRIARRLAALGIGPEDRVGILLERGADMVAAMLGVLGAGGAYVPLDPDYPAERLAFMLADSGARVLVTGDGLEGRVPEFGGEIVAVAAPSPPGPLSLASGRKGEKDDAAGGEALSHSRTSALSHSPFPENAAYVIYTSGSTGRPKGVVVTHAGVAGFFAAMRERVGAGPGTWLAVTSIAFDISVVEILWTLCRGSKVVLRGPGPRATAAPAAADSRPGAGDTAFSLFYFAAGEQGRGSGRARYRLLLEGARWADRNGFEAVWTPERHFHAFGGQYPNPSVTSAALATITERVRLRAGSVVLPLHDPIRVAEEWAVVDNLSDGRVEVSFASGWHADDFVLAPERYGRRREAMFEGIEEVRRLWRGGTTARVGGNGATVEVATLPRPVQPELPVWVTAAGSPDTFRLAGRAGAHLLTHLLGQSVEELAERVRAYREGRREGGHDPEAGRVALMLHTFVGDDDAAVRATVRGPFREYLRTSFDLVLRLAGSAAADASSLSPGEVEAMLDAAFERFYRTSGLMGTPEACLETVRRVRGAGVDEVACLIDFGVDEELVLASLDRLRGVMEASRATPAAPAARPESPEPPLAEQMRAEGVTHLQCTPTLAGMLARDPEALRALGGLECILLGGETLPPALAARLREAGPARVLNLYGPTEATVWSTTHEVGDAAGPIPIGRPLANTRTYVVDGRLNPVPVGVAGELLVAGTGVARGYLGRAELTAERFVPDPFAVEPGARAYRTGDRARWRADGALEFLGRADRQVKVRGHRIEPGEVEAAIDAHPGVAESAVVAVEDGATGEWRLAAYFVPGAAAPRALVPAAPEERERILAGRPRFTLPDGTVVAHQRDAVTRGLYHEIFEQEVYLRHGITLEAGARVVDVGSNIGMFTLFAHTRAPGVRSWSFEPIPDTFAALQANTALYGLDARVFDVGLADAEGTAEFTFYPGSSGLSGRYADRARDRETVRSAIRSWARDGGGSEPGAADVDAFLDERFRAETLVRPLRTLSAVIREEGIERIDLLKVDVEKSEYDVLSGVEDEHWPRIRQVAMEVDTDALLERVSALLARHGFEQLVDRQPIVPEDPDGEYVYMLYAKRPGDGAPLRRTPPGAAAARPTPPTAAELRAYLAERLPDYMVPSHFAALERMPRTPGGKTDRDALPRAGAPLPAPAAAGYAAPRNALERTIAEVWRQVLGVERVGIRDNFFELGGTSVGVAAVHQALSERLDRPIAVVELFRHSTVAALAEHLSAGDGADGGGQADAPVHAGVHERAERQRRARVTRAPQRSGRAGEPRE